MVDILIYRHRIELTNYTLGMCFELEKRFMTFDNISKRYLKDKSYLEYDKDNHKLILPSTSDFHTIKHILEGSGILVGNMIDNTRFYNKYSKLDIEMNPLYKPRNQFQEDSVNFLTDTTVSISHNRLLMLPTGEGKTLCAVMAAVKLNMYTLVITDTLVEQWHKRILEYTTATPNDICVIRGFTSVEKILRQKNAKYKIYISSLKTLRLVYDESPEMLDTLFKKMEIGLKIIDECHKHTYSLFKIDISSPVAETIRLSATPKRSDYSENKAYNFAYALLPKFGSHVEDEVEPSIYFIYIHMNTNPTYRELKQVLTKYGMSMIKYAELFFNDKNYEYTKYVIRYSIDKILSVSKENDKMLVILETIEHIDKLAKDLRKIYGDDMIGVFCTLIQNITSRQMELNKKIILTTYESMGEGKDIKGLKAIISTISYGTEIWAKQLSGRLRPRNDGNTYFVDIVNDGVPQAKKHLMARQKVFRKKSLGFKNIYINRDDINKENQYEE